MASAGAPCKHPSPYRMSSLEPDDCKGVQVDPERVEVSVHPLPERIHPVPSRQTREQSGACQGQADRRHRVCIGGYYSTHRES